MNPALAHKQHLEIHKPSSDVAALAHQQHVGIWAQKSYTLENAEILMLMCQSSDRSQVVYPCMLFVRQSWIYKLSSDVAALAHQQHIGIWVQNIRHKFRKRRNL